MLVVYAILFSLALWRMKFAGKSFFTEESFSRDVTDSIKGIFIWLVFLSHFASYVVYSAKIDVFGHKISLILGQLIVACFLFYSGYGVMEAIKKRGSDYVKLFPKNRVLKTLIHFDIAVVLFLIVAVIVGKEYPLGKIIMSFFGWEAIGNSNWYIFVVIVLYLLTWIAFTLIKSHIKLAAALVTMLTFGLIVFLKFTKQSHWYDTALCYVLGMWISIFKNEFFKLATKNNLVWLCCIAVSGLVFGGLYIIDFSSGVLAFARMLALPLIFCLVIAVFLTKFKISNPVLAWSGRYTFELYILQRIPMILFKYFGLANVNIYLYFVACLVATVLIALGFRYCLNKVDGVLFKKK